MSSALPKSGSWLSEAAASWNRFWFVPQLPHTLAVIRILCGAMLVYVHGVWLSMIGDFFGPNSLGRCFYIQAAASIRLHRQLFDVQLEHDCDGDSRSAGHSSLGHDGCRLVHAGRNATGLVHDLDGLPSANRRAVRTGPGRDDAVDVSDAQPMWRCVQPGCAALGTVAAPRLANNIAMRLLQLHLCIIYLFGGLSKMRGDLWWEGSAMWWSVVNYEYQSLDVTWLGRWPLLIALLTHVTLFWETFYAATIWPRLTRPFTLAMAVFVHGGIALALGMPTFGFMMIVANLVFVHPKGSSAAVLLSPIFCPITR